MSTEHHHTYPAHAHEAFPKEALERVQKVVAEVERSTHVELRISIRDQRDTPEAELSLEMLAKKEFAHLGMHETKGHNGVLLFILYDERKFFVFADEGVHTKTSPDTWKDVADTIRKHFRNAEFEAGLTAALGRIEQHLKGVLPEVPKAENELSDEIAMR